MELRKSMNKITHYALQIFIHIIPTTTFAFICYLQRTINLSQPEGNEPWNLNLCSRFVSDTNSKVRKL